MTTFAELNIPFPLFEGPTDLASEYRGLARCSLCGADNTHCFELGIGGDIVVECTHCARPCALDVSDRESTCQHCSSPLDFPVDPEIDPVLACYACLRTGRAALTKDTRYGMVRWQDAIKGMTDGVPRDPDGQFEAVEVTGEEGWFASKIPSEHLLELVRTPTYHTWQGECWQFCCKRPMTYIGQWNRADFNQNAPDGNGEELFNSIVRDPADGVWEYGIDSDAGVYVFQCKGCGHLTVHWDCD